MVERAIKLMEQGTGPNWRSFSNDEIHRLLHLLQCTWNTIDEKTGDAIPFSRISSDRIQEILSHGEGVRPGHNPAPEAVAEIRKILMSLK